MTRNERLHSLDAVRAFALLAGIVLHATMSFFLPAPALDVSQSQTLGLTFYVIHIFRMSAFYLIAGFFARMVLERRGFREFAKDRAKRILGPMIGGWIILAPPTVGIVLWGAIVTFGPGITEQPAPQQAFPLLHLWFLYYLSVFYVLVLALRWLAHNMLDRNGKVRALVDGIVRVSLRSYFAPVLLAAPLAIVLNFDATWAVWFGIPTPDQGFSLKLPAMVGFGTAFLAGWLIHRQIELIDEWQKRWAVNLALAVCLTLLSLSIVGFTPPNVMDPAAAMTTTVVPGPAWFRIVHAAAFTLSIWYWTFAIIGIAMRFFDRANEKVRYIADASYWLYLAHLPVVFFFQVLLAQVGLHWSIKFPLILAASMAILLVTYRYWVRHTWIGAILNGRRHPRPEKRVSAVALSPAGSNS